MGGEGRAVFGDHLVRVAVVRRQQGAAAHRQDLLQHLIDAVVHRSDGLFRRFQNARVADHVAVGEVQDHHVVLAGGELFEHLFGHFVSAHFRLQIVSGHLGGRDEHAHLARIGRLDAAVEEEGDVRVFFRFGDAQLLFTQRGEVLAQRVLQALRLEGDVHMREGGVVLGEADVVRGKIARLALEAAEIGLGEGAGDLSGAVGAEVEEDDAVALFHQRHGLAARHDVGGEDELVRHILFIRLFNGCRGVFRLDAVAEGEHLVCLDHALPAVVSVHGVVSAADGGDGAAADLFHLILQSAHKARARGGRYVSAVHEAVHEHVGKPFLLAQL